MKRKAMVSIMLLGGISVHAQQLDANVFRDARRLFDSGKLVDAEKSFAQNHA